MFINTIIKKKYVVLKLLGKGITGSVYLVYNLTTSKYYALKISNRDSYDDLQLEYSKYNDIKSKINNSYLVKHYEIFSYKYNADEYFCICMDLYQYTLYDIIKKVPLDIKLKYFNSIFKQISLILADFHKHSIVLCDLKPENILFKLNYDKNCNYYDDLLFKNNNCKNLFKNHSSIINFLNKNNNVNDNLSNSSISSNSSTSSNSLSSNSNHLSLSSYTDTDSIFSIDELDTILSNYTNIAFIDFEASIIVDQSKLIYPETYTLYYYPPECILGDAFSVSYDIWSLGCIMYEYITSTILFDSDNMRELLFLFVNKLDNFNHSYIKNSRKYNLYFQFNSNKIKPIYNYIADLPFKSVKTDLIDLNIPEFVFNIILSCLKLYPNDRITSSSLSNMF